MINLLPKDYVFFDLFESMVGLVVQAAEHLRSLCREFPTGIEAQIQKIRDVEHSADKLAHTALDRLDRTFITPFDREDIHELIGALDDIIDDIDALAKHFPLYHVKQMRASFVKQTDVLIQATMSVSEAVHRLRKCRKLSELADKLIEIHHHESIGDDINHSAVSELYSGTVETLEVLKWKEFYDRIERAIDGCEDVGNILERIVLKNG